MNRASLAIALSGWRRTVICIFTVAFVIRAAFVLALKDGFYFPDSVEYSAAAVNLIAHGEFGDTYGRAPIYPLFLAGIYILFGERIVAVRMVEALLGACLAVVVALIAKRIAGAQVGALAGLLWSAYPLGVFIAGLVYPTTVATMLLACAVLCIVRNADQELGAGRVVVGGILFGLAALTVPVVLATVVTTTLWMMYWQRTRRLLLLTLFLLGAALPLTPWTVRNFYLYDGWVIIDPRLVQHLPEIGKTRSGRNAQSDGKGEQVEDKIKVIVENPEWFIARYIQQFGHFWELRPTRIAMNRSDFRARMHAQDSRIIAEATFSPSWTSIVSMLTVGPMFFLALIGTGAMYLRKERRSALSLLCIVILSFALSYSFFISKMRYRIPVEPYIIVLSAYGLRQVWHILLSRFARESVSDGETI